MWRRSCQQDWPDAGFDFRVRVVRVHPAADGPKRSRAQIPCNKGTQYLPKLLPLLQPETGEHGLLLVTPRVELVLGVSAWGLLPPDVAIEEPIGCPAERSLLAMMPLPVSGGSCPNKVIFIPKI
jgi:hypothetical protein